MFKLSLGAILVVGVMYIVLDANFGQEVVVTNEQSTEVELTAEELFEQAVTKTIEEAITASSTEIKSAKQKAAEEVEAEMKKEIEDRVRKEMRDRV